MESILFAMAVVGRMMAPPQPFTVQFSGESFGKSVMVCLDGYKVEKAFAGKLKFRDRNRAWYSVCAAVRNPVSAGQFFDVQAYNSGWVSGNAKLAGNIIAANFKSARTDEQCAALQIAVWEAMEDGGKQADFDNGRFAARTTPAILAYAAQYYGSIDKPGIAAFLKTHGVGQSQITLTEQ